jgi:hypothetical protein
METQIKIFNNPQFGAIRTAGTADKPLFCATDIARVLQYANPAKAIIDHCKGVTVLETPTKGGIQPMKYISEGDMYRLIFKSSAPKADEFNTWVADEVLPTIRKTGGYIATNAEMSDAEILAKAVLVAQSTIEQRNERIKQLEAKAQEDAPKVVYFDNLVDRGLNVGFRVAAKEIGVRQNEFVKFLLENKYVYRDKKNRLQPYMNYINDLFVVKDATSDSCEWSGTQTLITPKGKETFRLLLKQ